MGWWWVDKIFIQHWRKHPFSREKVHPLRSSWHMEGGGIFLLSEIISFGPVVFILCLIQALRLQCARDGGWPFSPMLGSNDNDVRRYLYLILLKKKSETI